MEKDDEVKGGGNSYDFGARMYDSRVGRFLSRDPREKDFPFLSVFCYAANDPIRNIDFNGEGPGDRVKAAKQFITSISGYTYSMGSDNVGQKLRTTFTTAALKKQDCVELVTRVLYEDGALKSMNLDNGNYYIARKASIGKILFDKEKFIQDLNPKVGDVAFWEGHVGIVSEVGKDGKFKLIHAANSRSNILENKWPITASEYNPNKFYGFFRPKNETEDGKEIDITRDVKERGEKKSENFIYTSKTDYEEIKVTAKSIKLPINKVEKIKNEDNEKK